MGSLQNAVVNHEADTYSLYRRVCPDCHTFRAIKDYTTRRIRTVLAQGGFAIPAGWCAAIAIQAWWVRSRH